MHEQDFISSLSDLTGNVAVVTGGAAGIGLECTIYLARLGATVYVPTRNRTKAEKGIREAIARLSKEGIDASKRLVYHQLDLSSMKDAWESAINLKTRIGEDMRTRESQPRLDILVANAGVGMLPLDQLSPDGYEPTFATNHLGHFSFTLGLLPLIHSTSRTISKEARIVVVASFAHKSATRLDYTFLRTPHPSPTGSLGILMAMPSIFQQYSNSKLANVYFTLELSRRLHQSTSITPSSPSSRSNIYVNCVHPGTAHSTGLGSSFSANPLIKSIIDPSIRAFFSLFASPVTDVAKTQTWLAASPAATAAAAVAVRKDSSSDDGDAVTTGSYWSIQRKGYAGIQLGDYAGCQQLELEGLAKEKGEWERLWRVSWQELESVVGGDGLREVRELVGDP